MSLIFGGIARHTGPGLALQELLYGFIMALLFLTAARFGILKFDDGMDIVILMVGMDFTWGMIDAVLFYVVGVMDQERMINVMRSSSSPKDKADELLGDFDGTPMGLINPVEERKFCEQIMEAELEGEESIRKDRANMMKSSFFCFIATISPLVPTALPLLLFEDIYDGMLVSSVLASVSMFVLGWMMGKYIGVKGWKSGLIVAVITWAITLAATFTGG